MPVRMARMLMATIISMSVKPPVARRKRRIGALLRGISLCADGEKHPVLENLDIINFLQPF
jgi:hypothetical protein